VDHYAALMLETDTRFEVFTMVETEKLWFSGLLSRVAWWLVTNPEDRDNTVLRNFGIQPPHYIAQQPRKLWIVFAILYNILNTFNSHDVSSIARAPFVRWQTE